VTQRPRANREKCLISLTFGEGRELHNEETRRPPRGYFGLSDGRRVVGELAREYNFGRRQAKWVFWSTLKVGAR
jgi:hypothetical protein